MSIWLYLLEQMSLNCCLLLTIGLSTGSPDGPGGHGCIRLGYRSAIRLMGVSAVVAILSAWMVNKPDLLRAAVLLLCAVGAPLLAWPGVPKRLRGRMIASGSFLSLGMTGVMRFMQSFALPAALMVLVCCLLLGAVPLFIPKPGELPRIATIDIRHGPHHLTLTALIDSGNLLRDGVTGLPVVVVSRRAAERLVQLPQKGKLTYPFRLLTVRTISGTTLMTIFHPDSVCIKTSDGWQRVETLLGVSPDGYDGFQALVPACLVSSNLALSI